MKAEPGKPLDQGELERLISTEMVAGLEYVYGPDNIAAERDRNYDYYRGIMNDLPAANGRSRVVEPVVANYIGLMKPSLMRIFTSGRNIAEYVSPKPEMQKSVKLITRFINDVVFRKDNRGELLLGDWAEDAIIQKLGVVMYWWEESQEAKDEILEGITEDVLSSIFQEIQARGAEIVEHTPQPTVIQTEMGPVETQVHSLKVRAQVNTSKCCIDAIPPEEFIVSRDARTLEDAILKAHRTGVMVGDLIRAGYDPDVVNGLPTYTDPYPDRTRKYNQAQTGDVHRDQSADPMLRKVCIARGILKCDADGTGIKEWYIVAGGPETSIKLLEMDAYNNQVGFADFCPEPMPHTIYGRCPADRLAGIQKVETVLVRGMLDSMYLAITPQREVVMDWIVKPDQLMNMAPGAPVLVKQPNAIREIAIPFVGAAAMQGIAYFEGQAELTTGVGKTTAGLDPDALQNQSATASNNMYSAMQGRVEMIARIWAQGGMRKLFRGVFKCIKAYQDFSRVVQIDGAPQTIDPSMFDGLEDLDVNINTGLGTGNRERDYMMLQGIAATQKEALQLLGPGNPVVDVQKIVRTEQLKCEAAGVNYPENFFGDAVNPDGTPWAPEPETPQPSPDATLNAQTLLQIETGKQESDERKKIAEIASNERIKMYEIQVNAALKAEELGIDRASVMIDAARVDVDSQKIANDMQVKKKAS
jgi:hypothetical protein